MLPDGKKFYIEKLYEDDSSGMKHSHFHDFYEIYYLLEGTRRYFINHTIYDVVPCDVLLVNKGDVHLSQSPEPA
ncbi:MAG: AraC family ligand binding domain-containing protein, partial [Candidatus Ornithomonoglobus sp.]